MADELSIGLTKLLRKAQMADAHLLSAFSQRRGVVLGQVAVPDKSNEITAIDGCPLGSMLARLVLTGWVVTTDAFFTQTDIAQAIGAAGGHYLMAVKGNQPTLHDARAFLFADLIGACQRTQETRLHGGRIERRVLRASTELTGDTDWLGMAQAVCMERRVTEKSSRKTRTERAYAATPRSCWPCGANTGRSRTNSTGFARSLSLRTARRRAGDIPQVMAA